jgi:hypothetical protein
MADVKLEKVYSKLEEVLVNLKNGNALQQEVLSKVKAENAKLQQEMRAQREDIASLGWQLKRMEEKVGDSLPRSKLRVRGSDASRQCGH